MGLPPEQGKRHSAGYPAWPDLADQAGVWAILHPERIGITLTEAHQMVPEQSTSAIIVWHPEASYYSVRTATTPCTSVVVGLLRRRADEVCCVVDAALALEDGLLR